MMNQAIHTVDLLQWLVGDVVSLTGHSSTRVLGETIAVEDTAEFLAEHANGARSLFYASLANSVNAPVTLDIVTEKAALSLRGDLTVTYGDGRVEVIPEMERDPERGAPTGGRAYWGLSHKLLIRDFYARIGDPGPFWIGPDEAFKSLAIVKELYRQSYPTQLKAVS
jgi:predicted dehydrogenase